MQDNNISVRLKELRTKRGLSQTQVAKDLGIPVSTYNAYETGQNVPRDETKIKIAEYFKRSVQFIFYAKNTHQ